jgi:hypothetical protein
MRIHKVNIELLWLEARYYDSIHSEIYNQDEQEKNTSMLKIVDKLEGKPKEPKDRLS